MIRIEVLTDQPEARFVVGHALYREGSRSPLTIAEAAAVDDGPGWRLRFAEIGSRNAAESLRDAYLETIVDRGTDLEPGAAYWHEVIGVEVHGVDGRLLGTVADIYRVATAEILVVRGGDVGEFDLPLVKDIVKVFAPERGEIVVDEAVLDLAAPAVDGPPPRPPRKRPRWSRHGKGGRAAGPSAAGLPASPEHPDGPPDLDPDPSTD